MRCVLLRVIVIALSENTWCPSQLCAWLESEISVLQIGLEDLSWCACVS